MLLFVMLKTCSFYKECGTLSVPSFVCSSFSVSSELLMGILFGRIVVSPSFEFLMFVDFKECFNFSASASNDVNSYAFIVVFAGLFNQFG